MYRVVPWWKSFWRFTNQKLFRRSRIFGAALFTAMPTITTCWSALRWPLPRRAQSVIDFGDMHLGMTVSEVAIAAAYAMLGKEDVLSAAASVVSGYHEDIPSAGKRDCRAIHAHWHAPGGQRYKFRLSPNPEARRSVCNHQRSPRLGSARAARESSSTFCALHLSPCVRLVRSAAK